jgi:hypothetical protein
VATDKRATSKWGHGGDLLISMGQRRCGPPGTRPCTLKGCTACNGVNLRWETTYSRPEHSWANSPSTRRP